MRPVSPMPYELDNPPPKKLLLDRVRDAIRAKHYSLHTENAYVDWIKRYTLRVFHHNRHPDTMGASEINTFLTHLAVEQNVAASTQTQALSALLFLYRQVLCLELEEPVTIVRARKPDRLPVVLAKLEIQSVLRQMFGIHQLMAKLLYGSGLRLMECVRLRVKDVDFGQCQVLVRDGKGMKDRVTMLPDQLRNALELHLARVKQLHESDLEKGGGAVYLLTRSSGSIPMPTPNGDGNMCFLPTVFRLTHVRA